MNQHDQLQLESERTFLRRQLESLPADAVLTRSSAAARIQVVENILSGLAQQPPPTKAQLTFRGRPVIGSRGVFVEFGSRAINAFSEALVTVGAALLGPIAPTGPIPDRDQCQFLITSTAIGSFGFELEQYRPDQLPFGEDTIAFRALDFTIELLKQSAKGSDDELADSVNGMNPRSIDAVRAFVEILASNEAVCTLVVGRHSFGFRDIGEVRRSLVRLSHDNLHETETELFGEFQGVLPKGRTFEFKVAANEEIVRGKIGPEIDGPETLNQYLNQPVTIKVLEIRIGAGKPRYQLVQMPKWTLTEESGRANQAKGRKTL